MQGESSAAARCGEEFLDDLLSTIKPEVLEKRISELNLSKGRFRELALEVLEEWDDFGEQARNARHLFNQVRYKLRVDPSLRSKPESRAIAEYRAEKARRREERDKEAEQLRSQVKASGKTSWQLYCESQGLDPETTSAAEMALSKEEDDEEESI